MRILASPGSDPMLLDSLKGMNRTFEALKAFLEGSATEMELRGKLSGSPEPYQRLLGGLRVRKDEGPIRLLPTADDFLELSGSVKNLARYIEHFSFGDDEEAAHHHPEHEYDATGPVPGYMAPESEWLIIEVDSVYVSELDNES